MKLARMPDGSPEIFHTLQGEGRNTGLPSVFIRASFCNLHCRWCDTDYTWNWEGTPFPHDKEADPAYQKFRKEDLVLDLSTEEIVSAVSNYPCHHYVFTGGEPLLQEKAWCALIEALSIRFPDSRFEVESNGTLFPGPDFLGRVHQINVSPKLANSDVARDLRLNPDVLRKFAETEKADFKFVIGDAADLEETLQLLSTVSIAPGRVFLMPMAASLAELEANQAGVAALAQAHGFRYSDRLHLRLFGAKRGV